MSELITAANIDLVIEKNNEIRNEVLEQTMKLQVNSCNYEGCIRTAACFADFTGIWFDSDAY